MVKRKKNNIRLMSDKVDYRKEVETLRMIENYNPRLLEEIRKPLNSKKSK